MNLQKYAEIGSLKGDLEIYQSFISQNSEARDRLVAHFAASVESFVDILIEDTLSDINIQIDGHTGDEKQITSFAFKADDKMLENASEVLDAPKELLRSEICFVSEVKDGGVLDVIARIKHILTNNALNIPLSQEDKEKIFCAIDKFMVDKTGVGLETALSDDQYLHFSEKELSAFRKIKDELSRIEICNKTIDRTLISFYDTKMQLKELSQGLHLSFEDKIKQGFKQVIDKIGTAIKVCEASVKGTLIATAYVALNPFEAAKQRAVSGISEKYNSFVDKTVSHMMLSSYEMDVFPDEIETVMEEHNPEKTRYISKVKQLMSLSGYDIVTAYYLNMSSLAEIKLDGAIEQLDTIKEEKAKIINAAKEDMSFLNAYKAFFTKKLETINTGIESIEEKVKTEPSILQGEEYLSLTLKKSEIVNKLIGVDDCIQKVETETASKLSELADKIRGKEHEIRFLEGKIEGYSGKIKVTNKKHEAVNKQISFQERDL